MERKDERHAPAAECHIAVVAAHSLPRLRLGGISESTSRYSGCASEAGRAGIWRAAR